MCGRFSLRARLAALAELFGIPETELPLLSARYNIAPTQPVLVVRRRPGMVPSKREAVFLRWGLIPGWADAPTVGGRLINARAETVAVKPAFREAFRHRRCLIAADGFYEWAKPEFVDSEGDSPIFSSRKLGQSPAKRKRPTAVKQPYFIHFRDDRPFAFAGLWEAWQGSGPAAIQSCTIITTAANPLVRPIHDRMPVILPPSAYARWLDPALETPDDLLPLLVPWNAEALESYPVGPAVNRAANDVPEDTFPL
ncbi:MAG: SOS response-associated peptidase [Pirellulales bacterium]|nr:SOS response-associated peptidase [Pirellulales bacterium]